MLGGKFPRSSLAICTIRAMRVILYVGSRRGGFTLSLEGRRVVPERGPVAAFMLVLPLFNAFIPWTWPGSARSQPR